MMEIFFTNFCIWSHFLQQPFHSSCKRVTHVEERMSDGSTKVDACRAVSYKTLLFGVTFIARRLRPVSAQLPNKFGYRP